MANFDELEITETAEATASKPKAVANESKEETKKALALMEDAFNEAANQGGAEYVENVHALSKTLEVKKVMVFSDKGGLIAGKPTGVMITDKNGKQREKNDPISVAERVGYLVANNGKKPIKFLAKVYECHEENFTEKEELVTLAPGKELAITKRSLAILGSNAQVSNVFANGKVSVSPAKVVKNLEDALSSARFIFDKECGITTKDDAYQVQIAVKGADGKWKVKPEYEAAFGYLNYEAPKATGGRTKSNPKDANAIIAAYISGQVAKKAE